MIIACPMCATGFNLPEDRITLKGVKLRCSKCGHVFRVRKGTSDEPEIFYKPGEAPEPEPQEDQGVHLSTQIGFGFDGSDEPDPKTIDLEPHLHSLGQQGGGTAQSDDLFSGDFGLDDEPSLAPPKQEEPLPVDESEEIFNNLTSLGAPSEPKLDLFEDASGFGGDDPFGGAFDVDDGEFDPFTEFSQVQEDPAQKEEEMPILMAGQPGMAGSSQASMPVVESPAPAPAQPALKNNPKDNDEFWSSGGAGVFGGADDMVDPNFGATDYFDAAAQEEQVTNAPPMMAPPKPATRQPTNNQAKQKPIRLATDPEPKPRAAAAPEDVVSPHKIGGNGAQKAANFVLIVLLVLLCFLGVVAALNDGMVDFKNFGHMLEVAFSGKPYQPRAEWVKASASTPAKTDAQSPSSDKAGDVPAPIVAGKTDVLTTFNVTMERVRVKKRKSVMVVRGHVKNNTDKQVTGAKISAQIINSSGDVMAKGEAYSGKTLSTSAVKKAKALKKIAAKLPTAPVAIDANTTQSFTVVLDAPAENDADAPVVYRVNAKIP